MTSDSGRDDLLDDLRRVGACECIAIDAATRLLSDREKQILADQLARVATHLATRVGSSRGLPPPVVLPGGGSDRIDLSAVWSAVAIAGLFVRNTMHRWFWADVLVDAERLAVELTASFVTAVTSSMLDHPTRMMLRLRAISAVRVVVELRDSPENAHVVAAAGPLITPCVEKISVRCGQHVVAGRTMLWAELARPELRRWI
ncbi:hypothetical protein [Nocardia vaccinii]|uniref:hypothetical protein n=1 Tax=Nocardia vaccinii TaxID=1822 RepID=UPI0012F4BAAB|nr:hypothetical protein [Nocardia vaccinii]